MGRFTDKDRGYDKFIKQFGKASGQSGAPQRNSSGQFKKREPSVFVGIRSRAGTTPDGTSIAFIAAVNEFGSGDGRVPERSFLRSTIDENNAKYTKQLAKALGKVIDDKSTLRRELGLIGLGAAADVQRKITALDSPANAPSTIRQKKSSNPLINTGQLRASIDFEVKV